MRSSTTCGGKLRGPSAGVLQRWVALAPLAAGACWAPPSLPEPTTVLSLAPMGPVGLETPVEVLFSATVSPPAGDAAALGVDDRDGAPVAITIEVMPTVWRLRPASRWPAGDLLRVVRRVELLDAEGRDVVWPDDDPRFETVPAALPPRVVVRWPTPGTAAAPGTRWLALDGVPEAVQTLDLEAEDHALRGERGETVDGITRFGLAPGGCDGLCASTNYRITADRLGALGEVRTGTTVDVEAPGFLVAEADVRPGEVEIRWTCDEPVHVAARLLGAEQTFEAAIGLGRAGVWRADLGLVEGDSYDLTVTAVDLVEQTTVGIERRVIGPAAIQVALREIVSTPRSDWGDSEPRGLPFDASPGRGTVSSADEWVELVNLSDAVVDIDAADLRIETLDRTPERTRVANAPALRFGDGGAVEAWRPGEALVVRTRGDMAQTDLTVEVWAGALLLERVVLGDRPGADHPGGAPPDLDREALARGLDGRWRWCRPTPGDPRPNADCS